MKLNKLPFLFLIAFIMAPLVNLAQDFSDIYNKVKPSVVVIRVVETSPRGELSGGLGSGVLISDEGHIMTASHVVQTADNIMVVFSDGQKIPATQVASVPSADVAMIKLKWMPENPVVAPMGDSDVMSVGNEIFVIGAPYGLSYTLSVGHISGRHIDNDMGGAFEEIEFFQTDASINHGNSGGPMFNMKGEVVGIVSFILSESGGFQGLGFASTINSAKRLLMESNAKWFGMEGTFLLGAMARILNVPQDGGLLIQKVANLSPVDIMGLKGGEYDMKIEGETMKVGGDIILAINDIPIDSPDNIRKLRLALNDLNTGAEIKLKVLRGGEIINITGEMP